MILHRKGDLRCARDPETWAFSKWIDKWISFRIKQFSPIKRPTLHLLVLSNCYHNNSKYMFHNSSSKSSFIILYILYKVQRKSCFFLSDNSLPNTDYELQTLQVNETKNEVSEIMCSRKKTSSPHCKGFSCTFCLFLESTCPTCK